MAERLKALVTADVAIPGLADLSIKINLATESRPYFPDCQIEATNDIEAVGCWLKKHISNPNTLSSYKRQAKLFLMWCSYEKGKTIGQLKAQDFEAYFEFLRNPPTAWCTTRAMLRQGLCSSSWRPLVGGLSSSAIRMAFSILQSLMNYLSSSQYIRSNPLNLIKISNDYSTSLADQKYQVWARMLEDDEWQAVQEALEGLPEENQQQLIYKLRAQFLFALLYFLGLRIHEVANHTWKAFQFREGKWWFFVRGKGGKLGHIPVHEQLLTFAKLYRITLNKMPLPDLEEDEPLLMSFEQKALQTRQIFNIVKKIGKLASIKFKREPIKAAKLKKLSPHWLRHLCASHQDKAGIHATMIRENLRHSSSQTTQIYLHAEENLRHEAMQKMVLKVKLKSIAKRIITSQTIINIKLREGPIHKGLGFRKLLEALEERFSQYQWQPYQFNKENKIKEIESSIIPVLAIEWGYVFHDLKEVHLAEVKKMIDLEASVRLFQAEINILNL